MKRYGMGYNKNNQISFSEEDLIENPKEIVFPKNVKIKKIESS
jgi:hypothetical protein